jgi:hypothetical protein
LPSTISTTGPDRSSSAAAKGGRRREVGMDE